MDDGSRVGGIGASADGLFSVPFVVTRHRGVRGTLPAILPGNVATKLVTQIDRG